MDYPIPTKSYASGGFVQLSSGAFCSTSKTGKWCIFRTAQEVDETWLRICEAFSRGEILAAIASTPMQAAQHGGSYVICVFTGDWQDEADVMATRDKLRSLGITEALSYKRDIETFRGVYGTSEEYRYRDVV